MGKFRNMITLKDPESGNTQFGFGVSVAIHNGYVVVGNNLGKSPDTGSVHVFKKSGMGFSYLQTLAAPDGEEDESFGQSVAIHDGRIVVGSPGNNSVYVYRLERGEFRYLQKIPNPDGGSENDIFGFSVAIHDGYIVVGAIDNNFSGSVYVYRLERGEFKHHQKIQNPDGSPTNDQFGISVSIRDGYIVIGAPDDNSSNLGSFDGEGSVYVYRLERGEFKHHQKIPNPDGSPGGDRFGIYVAIHDGYIVVGTPNDNSSSPGVFVGEGSVYVFRLERGEFRHLQKIQNPDKGSPVGDLFGTSVAIHEGRIVVGAPENNSTSSPGNAYIYSYGY